MPYLTAKPGRLVAVPAKKNDAFLPATPLLEDEDYESSIAPDDVGQIVDLTTEDEADIIVETPKEVDILVRKFLSLHLGSMSLLLTWMKLHPQNLQRDNPRSTDPEVMLYSWNFIRSRHRVMESL